MAQNAKPSSQVVRPNSAHRPAVGLLCSVKCPGKLILAAYDVAQALGRAGVHVISGFHSPMEQECLRIMLRSPNPVTWCLARGKLTQIPPELKKPVADGRLLVRERPADMLPGFANLYCLDADLRQVWLAEPPADGALFTEPMSLDAGSATCGTTSGHTLRLDLASGRRA